jgi:hypothetical protein
MGTDLFNDDYYSNSVTGTCGANGQGENINLQSAVRLHGQSCLFSFAEKIAGALLCLFLNIKTFWKFRTSIFGNKYLSFY